MTATPDDPIKSALDSIPTERDRAVIVDALNGSNSALRALKTEAREERATHHVAIRELTAALEKVLAMVPASDDPQLKAELAWIRQLAATARGPEGAQG